MDQQLSPGFPSDQTPAAAGPAGTSTFPQTPSDSTASTLPNLPPHSVTPPPVFPPNPPAGTAVYTEAPTTPIYAGFGRRLAAAFLDGAIVGVVNILVGFIIGMITAGGMAVAGSRSAISGRFLGGAIAQLFSFLISFGYFIYFTGSSGQTLGKKALKIKVIKTETNQAPGYVSAFLREVVGKFLSMVIFFLGYFWMIWDKEKQTWHDKIAGTLVVKV